MDGAPYPAYRDLLGAFALRETVLEILRVQPDPFAGPSRLRLLVPYGSTALPPETGALAGGTGARVAGLTDTLTARAVALRDAVQRRVAAFLEGADTGLTIEVPGQEVLDRSAVWFRREALEIRLECSLPARGRRILGRNAARLLLTGPERLVEACLAPGALDLEALENQADGVEDFAFLQEELPRRGWVAFVAEGSNLARRAGNDDRPLLDEAVLFRSPPELRREVRLPHGGLVSGMAIEDGVTLLCGGGFHGKSTLLRSLIAGLYPHVPGDGRERVAVRRDAQTVRAEDGRAVTHIDLRPFLHDLPLGRPVGDFTTENASGSTSQAASILEAMAGGSRLLLLDEDTSATNFMIRDALMERLIEAGREPITPYLHRARTLHEELGVSSVLVIGGSGEYFRAADRVLVLDSYVPHDRTAEARGIVAERPPLRPEPAAADLFRQALETSRELPRGGASGRAEGERGVRIKALAPRRLLVGDVSLELDGQESLRETAQSRFLARVLSWRSRELPREPASTLSGTGPGAGGGTIGFWRTRFEEEWRRDALDGFDREVRGDLAAVRFLDILAAIHRLRSPRDGGTKQRGRSD